MTTIDLTLHKDHRVRAIQRARERKNVIPK